MCNRKCAQEFFFTKINIRLMKIFTQVILQTIKFLSGITSQIVRVFTRKFYPRIILIPIQQVKTDFMQNFFTLLKKIFTHTHDREERTGVLNVGLQSVYCCTTNTNNIFPDHKNDVAENAASFAFTPQPIYRSEKKSFMKTAVLKSRFFTVALVIASLFFVSNASAQISLVNSASNTSTTASITINKPASVLTGDIMIAVITQSKTSASVTLSNASLSGWTPIGGSTLGTLGNDAWLTNALYRIVDGSEGSSFIFTLSSGTGGATANGNSGGIIAFRGVSTTNPFDVTPATTFNTATFTTTATATGITAATANDAIVMLAGAGAIGTTGFATPANWKTATSPGNLTQIFSANTTSTSFSLAGAAFALKSTTGTTGNGTVGITATSATGGLLIALKASVPPVITSIPGNACIGSTFNITGTGFVNVSAISINGVNAPTFTVNSSTSITVTVPSTAATGTVAVINPSGTGTSSTSITINSLPNNPSGTGGSTCGTGTVLISATPGAGETIDWYGAAINGTILPNGTGTTSFTTPSISTTTTYFAQARNTTTGCVSAARTGVIATVFPAAPSTTVNGTTNITCFGGADGTITINVTGGTSPFTFYVDGGTTPYANVTNNGDGTYTYKGLSANVPYQIRVKDTNGCLSASAQ
jgi:hypothetical protein